MTAMDDLEPGPEAIATGDPRVDEALRGLDGLTDLEVTGHPAVFERIHGQLAEVLSELRIGRDDAGRAAG